MFIKYNDTNVHAIPTVAKKTVRLRNRRTGKVRFEERLDYGQAASEVKWLRPGWNNFPKETWEQNKNHPGIKKMIEEGKIEVMAEKITIKKGKKTETKIIGQDDAPINLADFTETRACQIVKDTYDRDLLQRWLDEELRHKVKRALTKQIEPLLNNTKNEEDEE